MHEARVLARRAERAISRLQHEFDYANTVLRYINRLSDYFFAAARRLRTPVLAQIPTGSPTMLSFSPEIPNPAVTIPSTGNDEVVYKQETSPSRPPRATPRPVQLVLCCRRWPCSCGGGRRLRRAPALSSLTFSRHVEPSLLFFGPGEQTSVA
jgi:hypothetical protein